MSKSEVKGNRLEVGEVIRITDMYMSTTGKWTPAPNGCVGMRLQGGCPTEWIRPSKK